ncbi:MAG: DUF5302 domain-containing protein [Kutzneria sp.]|nr:DUF5302 domain-containing protein [Kutzneria sp.]MBV9847301.1 DUF5302 domain-containing protein [Kutzneria sp.]
MTNAKRAAQDTEAKRKFREILERKNQRAKEGEAHQDFAPNIHESHGPAGHKRTFRRKTG